MQAEASKIEGVDLELVRPPEDGTPKMRDEYQVDINPDECQRRDIAPGFPRFRRWVHQCCAQDKLDKHQSAQKPTKDLEDRHTRTRRDQEVKIVRFQAGDARRRLQT